MKILLAYYSLTGTTAEFARLIKRELEARGAQVDEVRVVRVKERGFILSGYEAMTKATPAIRPPQLDVSNYDVTVLGFPRWGGRPATPFYSMVAGMRNGLKAKRVALFSTSGDAAGARANTDTAAEEVTRAGGIVVCRAGLAGSARDQMPEIAADLAAKILGA